MDKVLPIIEKHVQWFALGLGALFLALMAYSYVVQTPVTVPVAGRAMVPSQVDEAVKTSPGTTRLEREMKSPELAVTEAPVPQVPPAVATFVDQVMKPVVWDENKITGANTQPSNTATGSPVLPGTVVARSSVPEIPAAYYVATSAGRGVYTWTPQVPPPPPPAVDATGQPVPQAAPAFVPPPQPVVGPLTDWVSHAYVISLAEMNSAFKAAGLDPATDPERLLTKTAFFAVELHRQEKLPNGGWGPSTVVPPLPEFQPIMRRLPAPSAPAPEKFAFAQWAAVNAPFFMQPTFPQPVRGDPWYAPGTPAPNQPTPAGAGGLAGTTTPPAFAPPVPGMIGDVPLPGGEGASMAGTPTGPIPGVGTPEGTFVPGDVVQQAMMTGQPDVKVQILAHDFTAQPGKTYRYMVRYYVRNPLWQAPLAELPPAIRDLFAAASKDSQWSKEIKVAPRVEFFVKAVKPRRGAQVQDEVDMDVFFDRGGQWAPATKTFSPGDAVGDAREGTSGWTVVDVRKDPRTRQGIAPKYYVIVADENGQLERRDVESDQAAPRLRQLRPPVVPPGGVPGGTEGGPAVGPRSNS